MIELLDKLSRGQRLSATEAATAMHEIMSGTVPGTGIAGFAMALAARGETVDEMVGMATTARQLATPLPAGRDVLDTCGTGGDGLRTFNISTAAAIVAAACGARVAKHGNRGVSSGCGSADVLEQLGVRIDLGPADAARCLDQVGITFLFAPVYHPAFRHAAQTRRELGVRTVFNLLGPLCNPARARMQVLGVPDAALVSRMADVLGRLGVDRAMVFHADDGMDELSVSAPSTVVELNAGERTAYRLNPAELGLAPAGIGALTVTGSQESGDTILRLLAGERGPARDIVLLNAAAAVRTAGLVDTWPDGLDMAARAIDTGAARQLLERWVTVSHSPAGDHAAAPGGAA